MLSEYAQNRLYLLLPLFNLLLFLVNIQEMNVR